MANWVEATRPQAEVVKPPRENAGLRRLFWIYFWLLIIEGILRKWVAPSLASPILLIRDPIPILMLWIGIRNRVLPRTLAFWLWLSIATCCLIAGFIVLPHFPLVALYGFRCDFLHLPVLFIAPYILDRSDLTKFINAILLASIPIALLMVYQFRSPPESWINSGIDNNFKQIGSTGDHIRPAGPFSFTIGPFCYFILSAGCLIGATVDRIKLKRGLLFGAAAALIVGAAFSGSRGLLSGIAVVAAVGMGAAMTANSKAFLRYTAGLLVFGGIALGFSNTSMIQDGTDAFSQRIAQAAGNQGTVMGLVDRYFGEFIHAGPSAAVAPILGYGLGAGTMGASAYLSAGPSHSFMMAEEEWPRLIDESGPVLGFLLIGFRTALAIWLGWISLMAARKGFTLPLCLFGACALNIISGAFGQSTLVGYTMITGGLCLTAARIANESTARTERLPDMDSEVATAAPGFAIG
jgi:hypothetical protein